MCPVRSVTYVSGRSQDMENAEDNGSLVIRFYEWAGKETDVQLGLPPNAQSPSETNLTENDTGDLAIRDERVSAHTKLYEIKTVSINFAQKKADVPE